MIQVYGCASSSYRLQGLGLRTESFGMLGCWLQRRVFDLWSWDP